MLQQFLRTASDGWDLALASVRNLFAEADLHADEVGGDFAGEAAAARAWPPREVHDVAAPSSSPPRRGAADDLAALAEAMLTRLDAALDVVPELAEHADGAARDLRRASPTLGTPASATAQRVHGDLHLGQTLRTVKGWKIVDFEGEPAKPLAERVLPDSPWRDVAGMLRSFDYAAARSSSDRRGRRATPSRADRLPGRRVGRPQPGGVPARLRRRRGRRSTGSTQQDAAPARLRRRQGRLRGGLRGPQPAHLAADPAGRHRPHHGQPRPRRHDPQEANRMTMTHGPPRRRARSLDLVVDGRHGDPHDVLGAAPARRRRSRSARSGRSPTRSSSVRRQRAVRARRTSTRASGSACST